MLAHDPVWFAHLPAGPHLMLAGHTHGGQIRLPGIGIIRNATKAPRRWSHGLVAERGQHLYVTSGIGTEASLPMLPRSTAPFPPFTKPSRRFDDGGMGGSARPDPPTMTLN